MAGARVRVEGKAGVQMIWRLLAATGVVLLGLAGAAQADDYSELERCVSTGDERCLARVGLELASGIKDPSEKAMMVARFGLIEWQAGRRVAGNALLLRAFAILGDAPNAGCANRTQTVFAFDDLARAFGHTDASRLALRALLKDAETWRQGDEVECRRSISAPHWLDQVAVRQDSLGDVAGIAKTLDLTARWALDAKTRDANFAPTGHQAAALLKRGGREADAAKVCDAFAAAEMSALPEYKIASEEADALWRGLGCYRHAGLTQSSQKAYAAFAAKRLEALGLGASEADGPADQDQVLVGQLWSMVQQVSWSDPLLLPVAGDFQTKTARACFERPTARCLALHGMSYVNKRRLVGKRPGGNGEEGGLDGFARFLVGAASDPVGEEARNWFLGQTDESPLEDLQAIVGDAIRTGDLVWARRIFYAWYQSGGDGYFRHLTSEERVARGERSNGRSASAITRAVWTEGDDDDSAELEAGAWPLHVAWTIALVVSELHPAFEPEELSEFAATAWDDGINQLPALKDIPRLELIDADERSGTHLLNLCFRSAFGQWAADVFTSAHEPLRAEQARDVLPEAARDCAFARRSVGPMLTAARWFQERGDAREARALLLEAASRLTRPHYHVYEDADPAQGGAALAASAIGLERGFVVPPPYAPAF